jgi:hypothetical protein
LKKYEEEEDIDTGWNSVKNTRPGRGYGLAERETGELNDCHVIG